MPSAVKIELWCDPCSTEDKWVEGEYTPVVTLGNAKPRRLILCPTHKKDLFDPIYDLLLSPIAEVVDTAPSQSAAAPALSDGERYFCPVEDCERHTDGYRGVATVRDHLVKVHGRTRSEARAMTNVKRDYVPTDKEAICPVADCGREFKYPEYLRPNQARGVHMAKSHGLMGEQYTPDGKGAKAKRHVTKKAS